MADADDTDTKIKKFCNWQGWQDFHRRMIHTVIELIKIGTDEGLYRNVNLSVVEEILTVLFEALGSSEFLNRTNFSYKEATDIVGDLVL